MAETFLNHPPWNQKVGEEEDEIQDQQQQPKEQTFTPPPPPYIATPLSTPGEKRQHDTVGDESQPKRQIVSTEGNINPLESTTVWGKIEINFINNSYPLFLYI
ncbi:Hypothetical predicted protein [Mytilus galloprovincialis]|uniref:Uncharacterized protein n=1 Tax=Mytilus galloprovincialis TaxID=29158 RepID=A0A8B6FGP5_MYTGA|nr:Hypothetical predicted protein [Mytilus galloprovincialis]